jgi:hypothetical protein
MTDAPEEDAAENGILDNSRRSRRQRVIDFIEASGLKFNDVLDVLRRAPLTLDDAVTDEHRDLVVDLKASGCPDEVVARFMRISEDRCKRLFSWELANGLALRTTQVVQALNVNAIQLGDTSTPKKRSRRRHRTPSSTPRRARTRRSSRG